MPRGKPNGKSNKGRGRGSNKGAGESSRREPTSAERSAQTNASDQDNVRRSCAKEMRRIQTERASLNEEAGDIREKLKNCGINVAAFMAALRVVDMDEETARDSYITELQQSFEALGVGGQLDMMSALDAAKEARTTDEPEFEEDDPNPGAAPNYLQETAGNA